MMRVGEIKNLLIVEKTDRSFHEIFNN